MLLKSFFISAYLSFLVVAVAHAAWEIYLNPSNTAWWFVLVACAPGLLFFVRVFAAPVARTAAVLKPIFVLNVLGAVALLLSGNRELLPWVYVLVVGCIGNAAYQFWYSSFGRTASQHLTVGNQLPDIILESTAGEEVRVRAIPGSLLVMFYRGNWCPLCMAQIQEVADQYKELAARGVQTVLVSSQPEANTASLAAKFHVPFRFLVDRDNRVARQLGILAINGTPMGMQALGYGNDAAMPTVILTDASKQIIFCDETENYRVRPEPATFLAVLDRAGA